MRVVQPDPGHRRVHYHRGLQQKPAQRRYECFVRSTKEAATEDNVGLLACYRLQEPGEIFHSMLAVGIEENYRFGALFQCERHSRRKCSSLAQINRMPQRLYRQLLDSLPGVIGGTIVNHHNGMT